MFVRGRSHFDRENEGLGSLNPLDDLTQILLKLSSVLFTFILAGAAIWKLNLLCKPRSPTWKNE